MVGNRQRKGAVEDFGEDEGHNRLNKKIQRTIEIQNTQMNEMEDLTNPNSSLLTTDKKVHLAHQSGPPPNPTIIPAGTRV